jgi:hypothetical protein
MPDICPAARKLWSYTRRSAMTVSAIADMFGQGNSAKGIPQSEIPPRKFSGGFAAVGERKPLLDIASFFRASAAHRGRQFGSAILERKTPSF